MIEQAASWFQIDQEIDIASVACFPAGRRTENSHVPGSVPGSDPQDFNAPRLEYLLEVRHGLGTLRVTCWSGSTARTMLPSLAALIYMQACGMARAGPGSCLGLLNPKPHQLLDACGPADDRL